MAEEIVESEYISTEFLSLVAIIFSIAAFYLYLQRLELPHITDDSWQDQKHVPETKVTSTALPFNIIVKEHQQICASLTNGILISTETSVQTILQCFWAVECSGVTEVLRSCDRSHDSQPSRSCDPLVLGEMLREISHSMSTYFFGPNTSTDVHLKMTDDQTNSDTAGSVDEPEIDLGPTPRTKYPLVVLLSRDRSDSGTRSCQVVIERIFWIFHLPDRVVTTPCHMISQLIITSQRQICDLQKVFLATDDELADVENSSFHHGDHASQSQSQNDIPCSSSNPPVEEDQNDLGGMPTPHLNHLPDSVNRNCTVCQNAPITRAILPCRHACVCSHCLALLSACPMCRGPIVSHFKFGRSLTDEDVDQSAGERQAEENQDWVIKIQNVMERLNELFSFV